MAYRFLLHDVKIRVATMYKRHKAHSQYDADVVHMHGTIEVRRVPFSPAAFTTVYVYVYRGPYFYVYYVECNKVSEQ